MSPQVHDKLKYEFEVSCDSKHARRIPKDGILVNYDRKASGRPPGPRPPLHDLCILKDPRKNDSKGSGRRPGPRPPLDKLALICVAEKQPSLLLEIISNKSKPYKRDARLDVQKGKKITGHLFVLTGKHISEIKKYFNKDYGIVLYTDTLGKYYWVDIDYCIRVER